MKNLFSMGIVLSAMILSVSSCKKESAPGTSNGTSTNDVILANSSRLGAYLTNEQGLSLYMFANDADGVSSCTGGCENVWPPFTMDNRYGKTGCRTDGG
jgi:predicted lipoprotein with Yx(FWY)xxD motif